MTVVDAINEQTTFQTAPRIDSSDQRPRDFGSASASSKRWIACGIFLVVLCVYVLTSPGRIDIVDGQARFDVAYNWIVNGRPIMSDIWIGPFMGVPGRDGLRYSYYGAPGSVFAIPLVWLGLHFNASTIQTSQFLFSLTSSIFGAGIAPILFLLYLELGVSVRGAFVWAMVSSFATYIWPISNSTFDNAQHAFFVIAAVYFGFLSARRKSVAYSVIGGLMAGMLVLYQEYFLLIIPALAVSTLLWRPSDDSDSPTESAAGLKVVSRVLCAVQRGLHGLLSLAQNAWEKPGEARSACIRYVLFFAGVGVGVLLAAAYNDLRFGSWLSDGKVRFAAQRGYPLFGNPLAGFLTLIVSPGKSVFLYSPPIVLGILGVRQLRHRAPQMAAALAAASIILVLFISCISFAGGDWCWGPRYLTPLLPLWALAFPFTVGRSLRRDVAVAIIGIGFLVQALALSVENQRFFFQRGLNDFFWAEDSWCYFKHSALFARVGEAASLNQALPSTAHWFSSTPAPDWTTYSILGPPPPRNLAPIWMRNFKIYFLPRPWPLWMSWLPPSMRLENPGYWVFGMLSIAGMGLGAIYRGFQTRKYQ